MKKMIFPAAIALVMFLSAFTFVASGNWKIADNYSVKFTSNDPSGAFTSMKGDIVFDENNLSASKFNVTIDAASINTGNGMKNNKAKSDEFLDATKYPAISFTSTKISKAGDSYQATGTLEMHGVKKEITIPFTFKNNTFAGTFDVNRTDYNVGAPGGHAATALKIDISVPVSK